MFGFDPTELQIDTFSSDGRFHQERITHLPTKKSVEGLIKAPRDRLDLLEKLRELVGTT